MARRPLIVPSGGSAVDGKSSAPSDWTLTIAPCELSFIRVDDQTRLQLEDVAIVIEGRFTLTQDGTDLVLNPADRQALGPVLAPYPTTLTAASIDPTARCGVNWAWAPASLFLTVLNWWRFGPIVSISTAVAGVGLGAWGNRRCRRTPMDQREAHA